ncbi:unnamed protein product [Adineta ricciae]|uniref:Uncharacterized protein n=1 Tax=Adineta ricciae TaxID=249248 RepID=A0A813P6P8_ADIRI|nr:unnamed protein product [Adineta ricciae]CAF1292649.1 unnamed protein product [Adineta ricciae]
MAIVTERTSSQPIDPLSRVLIIFASFFVVAALTLSIAGTATQFWFYDQSADGSTLHYNFFTQCVGNLLNGTSNCIDMQRSTALGLGTQHAAGLLITALCLLGLGMIITLIMNFIRFSGIIGFVAPILLFLAALFMVAAFAEGSRVTTYNAYSANLTQTGHLLTILSTGLVAFISGRLHVRYYSEL